MRYGSFALFFAFASIGGGVVAASTDTGEVRERAKFMEIVADKRLTIWYYFLSLEVWDDGTITGDAMGQDVSGEWTWEDGYFCRQMTWGSREIEYNCQLVEVDGDSIRFTTDQGAGDSADFKIK